MICLSGGLAGWLVRYGILVWFGLMRSGEGREGEGVQGLIYFVSYPLCLVGDWDFLVWRRALGTRLGLRRGCLGIEQCFRRKVSESERISGVKGGGIGRLEELMSTVAVL